MAKKPTVTTVASGYYGRTTLNDNFTALRDGFDNTLSLDGSTPNAMGADLDMNSNDVLNVNDMRTSRLFVNGVQVSSTALVNNDAVAEVNTVADLLSDTDLTYTADQPRTVIAGDYVRTVSEGFAYEVAASGATDQHVTTAGGVKLYVQPGSDGKYNILAAGCKPDGGLTNNYIGIQRLLDHIDNEGGGTLVVPAAAEFYGYGTILSMGDYTTLEVHGHLKNTNIVDEWAACAIAFGNYGGWDQTYGPFVAETTYNVDALDEGTATVAFQTAGESANFSAGDLVFIYDPNNTGSFYPFMMVNEVISVGSGTITVKHPYPYDVVKAGASELVISKANASGAISDIDGRPVRLIRGSYITGTGKMETAFKTGRQGIHVACYECGVEGVTVAAHRCLIGNPFAFSYARDCEFRFFSQPAELAQFCHSFILKDNRYLPDGSTVVDANARIWLNAGGFGAKVIGGEAFDCRLLCDKDESHIERLKVYGAPTTSIALSSARGGGRIIDCSSVNPSANGYVCDEPDMIVRGNKSLGAPERAMRVTTNCTRSSFVGNELGKTLATDCILDENGRDTTNIYYGNVSIRSGTRSPHVSRTSHTGTTSTTTIKSLLIPANSVASNGVLRVIARGYVSGTAAAKDIKIKAEGSVIASLALSASDTGPWSFDGYLYAQQSNTSMRSNIQVLSQAKGVDVDQSTITTNLTTSGLELLIDVTLFNTSDFVIVDFFDVEFMTGEFDV